MTTPGGPPRGDTGEGSLPAASDNQDSPGPDRPVPDGLGRPGHLRLVEDEVYADWEAAYRDNVERVYRLMLSRVGNRPDADDLTSEVFRAALGPMRLNSSKNEVRAYLLTTSQTVLASHWRRRLGLQVTAIDPDTDARYVADTPAPTDAPERAAEILAALPDRYRQILELRFLEARSVKEAARIMDVSVSNAKVLQHRALRMAAGGADGMKR